MEKSCGAIIINNNKILMVKQRNGVVGFPKGHVEKGETEEETALREIKEETNLDVKIDESKRFENSYIMDNGIKKEVVFFLASPINDELIKQDCEIEKLKWVDIDKVLDILTYDDLKELFKKALKEI